jgi:hypothetical protein
MIFWSLCAFIWFRNLEKMLLQMTSVSLQPVPVLHKTTRLVKIGGQKILQNFREF